MGPVLTPRRGRSRLHITARRRWQTGAVLCALVAVTGSLAAVRAAIADEEIRPGSSSPSGPPALTEEVRPAVPAQRAPSQVRPEAPVTVRLPSGRAVPVRAVSTRSNRLLDVPDDVRAAGWWRGGSRLGDPFGSTLVAAHIDSTKQGLGPFAELLGVRRDQQVRVSSRHLVQTFVVRSLRLVPQGSLSDDTWIFAASGGPRLTLVTCAPPYVRSRGGYQNLAVVTALPTGAARKAAQ